MRKIFAMTFVCLLSGCTSDFKTDTSVPVANLIRHIKFDLGTYQNYAIAHAKDDARDDSCRGRVSFDIKSVTVSLAAQIDRSGDGSASVSVPVGAVGTLGPSLEITDDHKESSTTNFTFFPKEQGTSVDLPAADSSGFIGTPISDSLVHLRESLLAASDAKPCYTFSIVGDDGKIKDQDNSIVYAFTVVRTVKDGASFKTLLFSLGATETTQKQIQSTITVKFAAPAGASKGNGAFIFVMPGKNGSVFTIPSPKELEQFQKDHPELLRNSQ